MRPTSRCTLVAAALSSASAFALFACGSTNDAPPPPAVTDASTPADAAADNASPPALDAGEPGASDADADADADAGGNDAAVDAAFDASPACVVRTSDTDAGTLDPTFHPLQWTPPRSLVYSNFSYAPTVMLAAAPGGDVYMAVPLTEADGGVARDIVILHVLASGELDGSFGGGGSVTLPGWSRLEALLVDHHGDVVVSGITPAAASVNNDFGLVALHPDGSFDFTVDPIAAGPTNAGTNQSQPCPGCIVDGDDGYLIAAYTGMYNIARDGTLTRTDALPQIGEFFVLCAVSRGPTRIGLSCGYGGSGGTEEVLYDLHGVLDPAFGPGGAIAQAWDFDLDPWVAWDGSLYVTADPNLENLGDTGGVLDHFLANGTLDPADPSLTALAPAAPVLSGAARCDGTELFLELGNGGLGMEVLGAGGPPLANAGLTPITSVDGGPAAILAVASDAQGAALVVSQAFYGGGPLQLDRILPSR